MDRRQRVLHLVDPRGRRGIEIGPLTRPIVSREHGTILYADHLPTEGLKAKYAAHADLPGGIASIVEVDLVVDEKRSLRQALEARGEPMVDYIVAAHVMEHVANPIGWLLDCARALRNGGALLLVVPDRRFTFDHRRANSRAADLIAHHLAGATHPTPIQVYDHVANVVRFGADDIVAAWHGRPVLAPHIHGDPPRDALKLARHVENGTAAIDVHCTTYTPFSFVEVFAQIIRLGLVPFEFATIEPTRFNEAEFLVLLRKRLGASPDERAASIPRLDRAADGELPPPRQVHDWRMRVRPLLRSWRRKRRTTQHQP